MQRAAARRERVYSRDEVEALISEGRSLFILNNEIVKADAWLKFHPGGDKALLHMIGRDATDEVTALHSPEARQRMAKYVIGKVEGQWVSFTPPIQGGVFRSRQEIETAKARDSPLMVDDTDNSSATSSEESSPIFDPADKAALRRRVGRSSSTGEVVSRSSSVSSISTMNMEVESKQEEAAESLLEKQTREMIEDDMRKYPDLDPATQAVITEKYRQLDQRIRAKGLYKCNYTAYAWELARYTFLFSMSVVFLRWGWYVPAGVFLGCFWHQLVFTAHDAGHMGITHNYQADTIIGIIIADFLGGLSMGWWKRSHNVHHIATNHPEHDPDSQLMPFFAISHRFFGSIKSTYYDRILELDAFAKFTLQYQHWAYYPILAFGRFNLYVLSWDYLISGLGPRNGPAWWHRWFEIAGQVFFWTWFGYGMVYHIPTWTGRIIFVLVSHMMQMPLHVQITLSHFAMSTADLGVAESFPQRMLRTTMDVDCPQWLDWFHGGLQFQAIHHLYPRIPRHNLRQTQKMVQEFCKEVDIPYALYGFVDGNKEVISHLGDVAKQARILSECHKHILEHGDGHDH